MPYIGKSPTGTGVRSRYYFTASGGETSLSGASDSGATLSFTDGNYVDVSLNGVALVAGTDYNTTTANTIGGLSALSASDIVEILVYDIFTVADTVPASSGGTFSGGVTMGGTLAVTGLITGAAGLTLSDGDLTVASGHGINFAATGDSSGTTTSELFDDYEEGTWTPIMADGNATYTTQAGYYTKVGNLVLCIYDIQINAIGSSNTQTLAGFPFTSANLSSGPVSYYASLATSVYSLDSYIINGTTTMYFTGHTTASGNISNALGVFQNSTRIVGAVTYRV